jgi:hypothetical protein
VSELSLNELRQAYEDFKVVSDRCADSDDFNAFADLYTEDCTYFEHAFGEMRGREQVRSWIVPLMRGYPISQMERSTHEWVYFDEENSRVVFCARTHMADPGDGSSHSATAWTMIEFTNGGLVRNQEDIYNPANFGRMIGEWEAARDNSKS